MKKIIKFIKYWGQLFILPIYAISFITPRKKNIWLFGSSFGNRFADNPRYLYLYTSQLEGNDIHPIWITQDKRIEEFLRENNLEVYKKNSIKGIIYCLLAGAYIFDNYSKDINFWLSGGAKKINLWHGTGNKKINYDNKFDKLRHPKNKWERFCNFLTTISNEKPSHYILATSEMMGDIFASAFAVPSNHIIIDGYPRNDVLFPECSINHIYTEKEESVITKINQFIKNNKYVILYLPTFRDSEVNFFNLMKMDEFNHFLEDQNIVFLTKLHPKSKLKGQFDSISYPNIHNIDSDIDTYTILGLADMLATDYSSIHTDFLMLNRPSVLFTYDLEEYSRDTRECYFDYNSYMPELRTYTMEEFMNGIVTVRNDDRCQMSRLELRNKMFSYCDCKSCERLYKKIYDIVQR